MRKSVWILTSCLRYHKFAYRKAFCYFAVIAIIISTYGFAYSFQLTLAWDPNAESDLAGYKVYYSRQSGGYVQGIDVGKNESVTISGLEPGNKYYFAVTAYNISDNESDYSDEVVFSPTNTTKAMPWIPLLLLND